MLLATLGEVPSSKMASHGINAHNLVLLKANSLRSEFNEPGMSY